MGPALAVIFGDPDQFHVGGEKLGEKLTYWCWTLGRRALKWEWPFVVIREGYLYYKSTAHMFNLQGCSVHHRRELKMEKEGKCGAILV